LDSSVASMFDSAIEANPDQIHFCTQEWHERRRPLTSVGTHLCNWPGLAAKSLSKGHGKTLYAGTTSTDALFKTKLYLPFPGKKPLV
jgi:hypothetical protein